MNIFLIALFEVGFYGNIVTDIHGILLVFIIISKLVSSVQFSTIFFKWFEIWPELFESRLALTQDLYKTIQTQD